MAKPAAGIVLVHSSFPLTSHQLTQRLQAVHEHFPAVVVKVDPERAVLVVGQVQHFCNSASLGVNDMRAALSTRLSDRRVPRLLPRRLNGLRGDFVRALFAVRADGAVALHIRRTVRRFPQEKHLLSGRIGPRQNPLLVNAAQGRDRAQDLDNVRRAAEQHAVAVPQVQPVLQHAPERQVDRVGL